MTLSSSRVDLVSSSSPRQLIRLGRTGLETTVVGLGCGGLSRLGLRKGGSMRDAADVVSQALDLGIRFIDTAKIYAPNRRSAWLCAGDETALLFRRS